jgi:hypothetical protein
LREKIAAVEVSCLHQPLSTLDILSYSKMNKQQLRQDTLLLAIGGTVDF